jgi:hypothetical protein
MKRCALLVAFATISVVSLAAHHRFSDEYDWKKPVTLKGTVSRIEWANPHVLLQVDGRDDSGTNVSWSVELGSPAALGRFGWNKDSLKPGDRVDVDAWRAKDGTKRANAKSVTLSDGRELFAASSFFDIANPAPVATSGSKKDRR